jgi:predicted nucleic acid-binding protein
LYLWDTNVLRHFVDGHENLLKHLQRVPRVEIALPSVVVAEALRGRCEFALKATPEQMLLAHELLLELLRTVQSFQILAVDQAGATVMAELLKRYRSHKRHPDLMIAAIAIAGNHVVVTRNQKHFADLLPKHQLQNWIDEPPAN